MTDITPLETELQQLPQVITAWRKLRDESTTLKGQLRENKVRMKALEGVILRTMKSHSIGALDLKQSNARLQRRTAVSKGSLSQKTLEECLAEHLKSPEAATKAMAFIAEKRGTKTTETLSFQNL